MNWAEIANAHSAIGSLANPGEKRKKPVKTLALGAEGTGLEQSLDSQGIDHISMEAKHKAKQLAALLDYQAAQDQRLLDIIEAWPTLTESQRNRAHKIALDASSKRGAQ